MESVVESIVPVVALLGCAAVPVVLVFINKYFKLRTRELELEAELHGRVLASRLQTLELRQQAVESALQSLAAAPRAEAAGVAPRAELFAGPDAADPSSPAAPQPRRLREP
jgi:uncharacterized membrane protein